MRMGYDQAIANHQAINGTGIFAQGATSGTTGGRFGTSSYDPENPVTAGTAAPTRSSYTAQSGAKRAAQPRPERLLQIYNV